MREEKEGDSGREGHLKREGKESAGFVSSHTHSRQEIGREPEEKGPALGG